MAICLKHSQQYNPDIGEHCPYCGQPGSHWSDYSTAGKWSSETLKKNKTPEEIKKE